MDGRQGGRAGPAGRRSRAAAACRSPGTGRVDRTASVAAPRDPGCCPGHVTQLLAGGGGAPLHQGPPRRRTEGAPCPLARTRAGQTGPAAAASGSWPRPASLSPAHGGERVPTRTGFHAAPRHGTPTRGRRRGLGLVGGRADPKPHGALSRQTPRGRERLRKAGPAAPAPPRSDLRPPPASGQSCWWDERV